MTKEKKGFPTLLLIINRVIDPVFQPIPTSSLSYCISIPPSHPNHPPIETESQ
jgi:hypothetical protein